MRDFNDKTVVITGGATGIGFGFAKAMGLEGAKIVIASRRAAQVDKAVDALKAMGIDAAGTRCDVTEREDVEALADFAWATYGEVDVLLNNAGVLQNLVPTIDLPVDEFRKMFEVNVIGAFHCVQVFAKRFISRKRPAAIYNMGSETSLLTPVAAIAYVGSKHALLGMTEALRMEMPDHIQVAFIAPGMVVSEMTESVGVESLAMPTDEYVAKAMPQLKNGEFFVVSHAHNIVWIKERYDELQHAFETYAPRYEGDDQADSKMIMMRMAAEAGE